MGAKGAASSACTVRMLSKSGSQTSLRARFLERGAVLNSRSRAVAAHDAHAWLSSDV